MKWQDCVPFLTGKWIQNTERIIVESQQRFAEHSSYFEHAVVRNRNPLKWLRYKRKFTGKEWDCLWNLKAGSMGTRNNRNRGSYVSHHVCYSASLSTVSIFSASTNQLPLSQLHEVIDSMHTPDTENLRPNRLILSMKQLLPGQGPHPCPTSGGQKTRSSTWTRCL